MQEHHVGKIKGPQTKNQNKSNTSSCAAPENLIKENQLVNQLTLASAYKMFTSITYVDDY